MLTGVENGQSESLWDSTTLVLKLETKYMVKTISEPGLSIWARDSWGFVTLANLQNSKHFMIATYFPRLSLNQKI